MAALAVALAVTTPLVLAGEKDFFHMPDVGEFRLQRIFRHGSETTWPFTVDEGYLSCAYVMGLRTVYFTETPAEHVDSKTYRTVVVSTDPFDLAIGNIASGGLVAKAQSIEALIKAMAPFEAVGERLCDQPQGTRIGPGEL